MIDYKNKKIFFLDMDGTIYHENDLIDGAIPFFNECLSKGIRYIFLTNNSSKNNDTYYKKLKSLGIPAKKEDIYSSIDATIYYLRQHNFKSIYLVGTKDFKKALQKHFEVHDYSYYKKVDCVVVGYDTELTYEKLRCASWHLENGEEYVATNPDFRCPIEDGRYVPDCGTYIYMFEKTTGRSPFVIGKPRPFMIEANLEEKGFKKEEAVMVGDRIYTDIACGINAGIDSILVMSGETTKEILNSSDVKPTEVEESIKDIYNKLK